jgi:regulatory protein
VKSKHQDALEKARNYAFLLLKFRLRSEKELIQRLKKKKFQDQIIHKVIASLKQTKLIDDAAFSRTWINAKLKKPLGLRRIRGELRAKGIDNQIIEAQIQEIKKDYSEEDIVLDLAKHRFTQLRNVDPLRAKRRVFAYLVRRGFSVETASEALRRM